MSGDSEHTVLSIRLPNELLDRIDDYWHRARWPNRVTGMRALMELALEAEAAEKKARPK